MDFHKSLFSSEGANSESEPPTSRWDDVALLSEQAQEQVLCVLGPAVDTGALEPVGDMSLQHRQSQLDSVNMRDSAAANTQQRPQCPFSCQPLSAELRHNLISLVLVILLLSCILH